MIKLILLILLLDFISGVVHWAEDTFWADNTPVIGAWLVMPNIEHHQNPAAFVNKTWLQSSWDLLIVGLSILGLAWITSTFSWQLLVFVVLGVNANQIHKWNHSPLSKIPKIVRIFQKIKLIQSPTEHKLHHTGEKNTSYCVITPYLNPLLDKFGFFSALDLLLIKWIDPGRRADLQVYR